MTETCRTSTAELNVNLRRNSRNVYILPQILLHTGVHLILQNGSQF